MSSLAALATCRPPENARIVVPGTATPLAATTPWMVPPAPNSEARPTGRQRARRGGPRFPVAQREALEASGAPRPRVDEAPGPARDPGFQARNPARHGLQEPVRERVIGDDELAARGAEAARAAGALGLG